MAAFGDEFEPELITVAYGTNDWSIRTVEEFKLACADFYRNLTHNYPNTKIIAITPIWRNDMYEERPFGDFLNVEPCIRECTKVFPNVKVISGYDLVPHDEMYFADRRLHPNDIGFEHYFSNLIKMIQE